MLGTVGGYLTIWRHEHSVFLDLDVVLVAVLLLEEWSEAAVLPH